MQEAKNGEFVSLANFVEAGAAAIWFAATSCGVVGVEREHSVRKNLARPHPQHQTLPRHPLNPSHLMGGQPHPAKF